MFWPGADYLGGINVTASGKTCEKWPEGTTMNKADISGHNFCRNPVRRIQSGKNWKSVMHGQVWCYTNRQKGEWEYCSQIQGLKTLLSFNLTVLFRL